LQTGHLNPKTTLKAMCLAVVWLGIVENTALEASGLTLGSIIRPWAALFSAIPCLSLAGCTSFNPFLGRAPTIPLGFPLPLPASWLYGTGQKTFKKKNPAIAQWIRVLLRLLQV